MCVFWWCLSGGSRCLVWITVSLGLICVLLLYIHFLCCSFFIFNVHRFIKCMFLCGSGWLFMSSELKSWSDSRQYCRDRGADLVIINSEEKQVSLCECLEIEGIMKWVDNSPLNQGEPNNYGGNEDCIELNFKREETGWSPLNSWNDVPCSEKKKGICEK
uniref:C-type lectin domain-containing protein n=1 Tax=Sinocyclocheilus grahami TaxID=75366 RepID=A0A672QEI5_SINGR